MLSLPYLFLWIFKLMLSSSELRTWASKMTYSRSRHVYVHREVKHEPVRPPSPIHPGLLHTASRPSSFILDISAKEDPDFDPWANSRVGSGVPVVVPTGTAYSKPVRSDESIARQQRASVTSPAQFSPTETTSSTTPFLSSAQPPPISSPAATHPPSRSVRSGTAPALSVRTSLPAARPNGPRSPTSTPSSSSSPHSALPDYGYGPGSAFGRSAREPSAHEPSLRHTAYGTAPSHLGTDGGYAGNVGTGSSFGYGPAYGGGAYDTHERPEWMPAMPPATLARAQGAYAPGSRPGSGGGAQRHSYGQGSSPARAPAQEERRSPTPPPLSPIMWARPEEYPGLE
jgi:hypothetical protein